MRVLITGITGFAGSHLVEYLLAEEPDVEIYGTKRWRSRMENIDHLQESIELINEGGFAEYYDPMTGEPCGGGRFTWTAAMVIEFLDLAGATP